MNKVEIPDKATFKIGEVAKLLELEPYVLRYWETEFEQLTPSKTRSGQRVYEAEDIEQLVRIRDLLYVEQYTIAGARRQLKSATRLYTSLHDLYALPAGTIESRTYYVATV